MGINEKRDIIEEQIRFAARSHPESAYIIKGSDFYEPFAAYPKRSHPTVPIPLHSAPRSPRRSLYARRLPHAV